MLLAVVLAVCSPSLVAAQSANHEAEERGIHLRKGPAVLFFILYLASTLMLWFHYFHFRSGRRSYMLPLTVGMTCMTTGFAIRMSDNYAWQFLFTFLTPCAFLANDYVLLKHIARAVGPDVARRCLFIPANGIVWIFVLSDVVTFCAQTAGTILVIVGGKLGSPGQKIALAGLALALVSFSLFCVLLFVFRRRLRKQFPQVYRSHSQTSSPSRFYSKQSVDDLRLLLVVLALSCIGIMIRSVFRLIEQADGFFGTIAQNEVWLYLFDAAPLWVSMTLFVFVWPPRYINGTDTACSEPSAVTGRWTAERHDGAAELGTVRDNPGRHKRHMPPPANAGRQWGYGGERT
ncbi:uncharacterized protein JCM10292_000289 [Rhodotorula paludigena]|uniref:uncharacterized protein n=1 Tax=Rhodotorula paludigena TaxID=86838 RepID=UPI00316DA311